MCNRLAVSCYDNGLSILDRTEVFGQAVLGLRSLDLPDVDSNLLCCHTTLPIVPYQVNNGFGNATFVLGYGAADIWNGMRRGLMEAQGFVVSSNSNVALDARCLCYTSHPLEIGGRTTVNEYMVWLEDGRTVIVRANTVVVRSTQALFMDATRNIVAGFPNPAGWAKRDNVSESEDAGEGADST